MRPFVTRPASRIKGSIILPGDKSIAHRSIIISAIAEGKTAIKNFPANLDCLATLKAFQALGVDIRHNRSTQEVLVKGKGLYGLKAPHKNYLFCAESGTTLRLLLGVLAGQKFAVTLKAGRSLSQRPMRRVNEPLRKMGARISSKLLTSRRKRDTRRPDTAGCLNSKLSEECPPITIKGGNLHPITYRMPVASAQV